jgi:hypothetical protein
MPTPAGKNTAAGFRNHFLGFTDDDNVLIGSSPTRPAQGLSSGMMRLWAAKRAAPAVPNPDVVIDEGDDGEVLTEYMFRSIASRGFIAEVAAQDLTVAAVLANVPVRSVGRGLFVAVDVNSVPVYNACAILQSRAIDAFSGAQQWSGVLIPRATATYLGRAEYNDRTPGVFRFFITPQPAGWSPLGYTYLDNNSNPKSPFYDEFKLYPNPITMSAFTGNGVLAAIPVDYQPISVAASVLSTVPASGQGATNAAITSVTTAAPFAVTATVAPVAATRNTVLYEFAP